MEFIDLSLFKRKDVSERFTFFLDKTFNQPIVIEDHETKSITYIHYNQDVQKTYICTKVNDGTVTKEVFLKNVFIIPDIDDREDAKLVKQGQTAFPNMLVPDIIFEVINYGLLFDPNFVGSNFSESRIKVLVQNSLGAIYQITMTVGKDVVSGDGKPSGKIEHAYKFKTPLFITQEGELMIQK